jgi:aspartate kinase
MIVQNLTAGRAEISFSVPQADLERSLQRTREVINTIDLQTQAVAENNIARLSVFGVGMRTHTGVARKMFGALAERGINIILINTSEVCVNVVVDRGRGEDALEALRRAFNVT